MKKDILVIAVKDKKEALRVANGLSILHHVKVLVIDGLNRDDPKVLEQLEAAEFAEIPIFEVQTRDKNYGKVVADLILQSEEVFII